MITRTWYKTDITSLQDVLEFIKLFKKHKPKYGGYDTESNGLHIIRCTPFLISFGFISTVTEEGYTWTHDFELHPELTKDVMESLRVLFNKCYRTVAHNANFDNHMLTNIGYPELFKNITDSMIYIRLAHDAKSKLEGGVQLKLKSYAFQYIDKRAKAHERKIKTAQKNMKIKRNRELKRRLRKFSWVENGRTRYWTIGMIVDILKDKVMGIEGFPENIRPVVKQWLDDTPDPDNYQNVPRDIVTIYAHYDIIYMLEIVEKTEPVLRVRQQDKTLELEESLIMPLYRMERVGFAFNHDYAVESKERMKAYIIKLRNKLEKLAGEELKSNQHKVIKEIINDKYDADIKSTGADVLAQANVEGEAKEFIDTLTELRTLEKWYSTYLIKWLEDEVDGRIYTTINQVGTISGRVSSNFQQFPSYAVTDSEGNELFNPRRMIKVSDDKDYIAYLDYSQIELRFQAMYTIFVSGGDTNLCRAYMPFDCTNSITNEVYDYENKEHIKHIFDQEWIENDTGNIWHKVDLHSATTKKAFPDIDETHIDWKHYRKLGKTTNFACNYGASDSTLHYKMGHPWDLAKRLFNAYNATFPGVKKYRDYITQQVNMQGYLENLFDRRYYNCNGHNGANYCVQGSAADFMKIKLVAADKYLQENPSSIRMQMTIHDELSFEGNDEDLKHIFKLKQIMEDLKGTLVPIVADIELTTTTWDRKADYNVKA